MGQQHEVVDRLVNIIQGLQSQRETGQLMAKHGNGVAAEEGVVVFVNGRVTEARIGRRTGSEAFNRLSKWESCICWFVRSTAAEAPPRMFPSSNGDAGMLTPGGMFPSTPIPFSPSKAEPLEENFRAIRAPIAAVPPVPQPVSQSQWAFTRIERLGLSRAHRRLFLLIDGQRSLPELIRLMGRGEHDIYALLQDLENAAVIRILHN